jgi:hypothetical protein
MLGKFLLCIRGSGDENRARICDRLGNGLEIVMIHRNMPAADGICLVMDVLGRMIGIQNESFDFSWIEVKHARFAVINPNDCVIVMLCHEMGLSCRSATLLPGVSEGALLKAARVALDQYGRSSHGSSSEKSVISRDELNYIMSGDDDHGLLWCRVQRN